MGTERPHVSKKTINLDLHLSLSQLFCQENITMVAPTWETIQNLGCFVPGATQWETALAQRCQTGREKAEQEWKESANPARATQTFSRSEERTLSSGSQANKTLPWSLTPIPFTLWSFPCGDFLLFTSSLFLAVVKVHESLAHSNNHFFLTHKKMFLPPGAGSSELTPFQRKWSHLSLPKCSLNLVGMNI